MGAQPKNWQDPSYDPEPSYQSIAFSPRQEAHVRNTVGRKVREPRIQSAIEEYGQEARVQLVQTGGGAYGTADNGLGYTQTVTYIDPGGGQSGSSVGYRPVLVHPDGNTLTVDAVTLSASPPPNQHFRAYWGYSCAIMEVKMMRNGVDITSPDRPEVPVMVGEKNNLTVSIQPNSPDSTYQWTIPGERIKYFAETTGVIPAKGEIIPLEPADLQN